MIETDGGLRFPQPCQYIYDCPAQRKRYFYRFSKHLKTLEWAFWAWRKWFATGMLFEERIRIWADHKRHLSAALALQVHHARFADGSLQRGRRVLSTPGSSEPRRAQDAATRHFLDTSSLNPADTPRNWAPAGIKIMNSSQACIDGIKHNERQKALPCQKMDIDFMWSKDWVTGRRFDFQFLGPAGHVSRRWWRSAEARWSVICTFGR